MFDRTADAWNSEYDSLRGMAAALLKGERADHTLQPTALVHELFLRFRRDRRFASAQRPQILLWASRAMRDVLVEHARARSAAKRGGGAGRTPLDALVLAYQDRAIDLLSLHEALEELATQDPQLVRIVELKFFGGLDEAEAAAALGVTSRTVRRGWRLARQWLWSRLSETCDGDLASGSRHR